jgi:hypothetical protein
MAAITIIHITVCLCTLTNILCTAISTEQHVFVMVSLSAHTNRAMQFTNMKALLNTDKIRSDLDRVVTGNLRGQVDNIVSDISTLIATRARTQSQAVLDFVSNKIFAPCAVIFVQVIASQSLHKLPYGTIIILPVVKTHARALS